MNPQPPVTRMRMAARTSSADKNAPAESSPTVVGLRRYLGQWQDALAGTDWVPWAILGLTIFLRFLLLGMKPPHFDEGINGWFVDQVVRTGFTDTTRPITTGRFTFTSCCFSSVY